MDIKTNKPEFAIEFESLAMLFGVNEGFKLNHIEKEENGKFVEDFSLEIDDKSLSKTFTFELQKNLSELKEKSIKKRKLKVFLYDMLSQLLGLTLPWGSLTGIRPTKLARDMIESGEIKESIVSEVFERELRVSRNKAKLVPMILKNQKCIIRNDNLVDLYVNIPVCPTRCYYCSFISHEISRVKDKLEPYLECLIKEITAVREIIAKKAYIVRTIYIGGGTPSILNEEQLDRLLSELNFPVTEFTVECGRPDTITAGKLDVLKKHGVTRISINPQTFCEATLKRIGRQTKNAQVLESYSLALERGFVVNMDIIAGLMGEKLGVFKRTIKTLLELSPDNITVHTLSVKNGSVLKNVGASDNGVGAMIDFAREALLENGYKPYYLYRQKNQLGGLENVGYFKDDKVCIFNIDSMEETNSILACGAGAMSKRIFNTEKRIERQSNAKFIEDYISRIDEIIEKKKEFFY